MSKPNFVGDISYFHYNMLRNEKKKMVGDKTVLSTGLLKLT